MVDAKPDLLVVFSLFLLFLLSITNGVQCFLEKKVVLSLKEFQWKQNGEAPSCLSQKSRRLKGATILEMKHRDSCSGKKIKDWNKKLQTRLILDDVHVRSLQSRLRNRVHLAADQSEVEIPLTSGVKLQTLNYIVTVELGGKNMSVIVDTGSDLTWIQCKPCRLCYNQQEPLFNPSSSPSYQSVPCNSSSCQSLELATGNSGACGGSPPTCLYAVSYGDGSYTRGDLGRENLNLGVSSPTVKDFVFGCGRDNKGLFGGASGLMGLAKSDLSVVSQTSSIYGGIFSYCLPSTETGSPGSLVMGGDSSAYKNLTAISYTKMVSNPELPTFYFLNLTGISVGGVALESSSSSVSANKGGILIDSGTVITRLAPSIYKAFKAEFVKQFSGYPTAPAFSILDTCFNLSGYQEVNIPTVTMHFDGNAELNVDVTGIFYMVKTDASQVCLAVASLSYENEFGIVGNYQQKNQRVIYDIKNSKLGFAGEPCNFE